MKKLLFLLCLIFTASQFAFAEESQVPKLVAQLKDPDPKVRAAAMRELAPAAADFVIALDAEKDPKILDEIRKLMESLKPKDFGRAGQLISSNETAAAATCRAFAESQDIYRRTDYNHDGVLEYAQTVHALAETKPGADDIGLVDRTFKNAEKQGDKATPKAGYYFKVLTAQGKDAAGREMNYMKDANMVLGFALIAFPSEYGVSGKNSFMISRTGIVYKKDLGAETKTLAEKMIEYNPDYSWDVVPENAVKKTSAQPRTTMPTEAEIKRRIEKMPDGDTRIVQYMALEKIPAYTKITDEMITAGIGVRERVERDQTILFKREQILNRVTLCDVEPMTMFKEGVNVAEKGKPASPLAAAPDGWGVVELFRDDMDSKAEYIKLGDYIALLANENGKSVWISKQAKVLLPSRLSEDDDGRTVILLAMKPEEIPELKRLKGKTKLTVVGVPGRAPLKVEDKF